MPLGLPTSNILFRVVRINGGRWGSGTIIDHGGAQYILTAAHVVEGCHRGSSIHIETRLASGTYNIIVKETRADVAIIKLGHQFTEEIHPVVLSGGFHYAQDVYLLGFPAGQGRYGSVQVSGGQSRRELNPFLRKGCISNFEQQHFYVDSIIQKGFSGGPVVIMDDNGSDPRIIGVISGGMVFDDERTITDIDAVTIRSGFTICQRISIAKEIFEDVIDRMQI